MTFMFQNTNSMKASCVQRIRNKQDLELLKQRYGHIALLFHSKNCSHCKDDLVDMENECRRFGDQSPIAFARCDLKDEECRKLWKEVQPENIPDDQYGYPVKIGLNNDSDLKNPVWFIHGRDPDKTSMVFHKLREAVGLTPKNIAYPYFQKRENTPKSRLQSLRSRYDNHEGFLCVDCDKETREKRMKAFILGL